MNYTINLEKFLKFWNEFVNLKNICKFEGKNCVSLGKDRKCVGKNWKVGEKSEVREKIGNLERKMKFLRKILEKNSEMLKKN